MMSDASMLAAFRVLAAQLAAFQALLLAASAIHKLVQWSYSKDVVRQFGGVPRAMAAWALGCAALGELAAAVLLVVPAYRVAGALLAALIWTAYLVLIVRAIVQGRRDVDCGCSFAPTRRLGSFQPARNLVLAGLAVLVAVSAAGGGVAVQGSQALGACALLALYAALDQVMALQPLRSGEAL